MARHAVVDLAQATGTAPRAPDPERLPPEDFRSLRSHLIDNGVRLKEGAMAETALGALRGLYEAFVSSLAARLPLTLPPRRGARVPGRRDRRESRGSRGTTWATTPSSERTAGPRPLLPLRGVPLDPGDDDAIDGRPHHGAAELKARLTHDLASDVGNIPRDDP